VEECPSWERQTDEVSDPTDDPDDPDDKDEEEWKKEGGWRPRLVAPRSRL